MQENREEIYRKTELTIHKEILKEQLKIYNKTITGTFIKSYFIFRVTCPNNGGSIYKGAMNNENGTNYLIWGWQDKPLLQKQWGGWTEDTMKTI